jgi:hypothetical protein
MRFLRDDGPDLPLDKVFEVIVDEDSSSSSDAKQACFAAAQARCANILIFGRKDHPTDVFIRGSSSVNPIMIDRNIFQLATSQPILGLEIIPWKPIKVAIALQLWPAVDQALRTARAKVSNTPPRHAILLGAPPRFEF